MNNRLKCFLFGHSFLVARSLDSVPIRSSSLLTFDPKTSRYEYAPSRVHAYLYFKKCTVCDRCGEKIKVDTAGLPLSMPDFIE